MPRRAFREIAFFRTIGATSLQRRPGAFLEYAPRPALRPAATSCQLFPFNLHPRRRFFGRERMGDFNDARSEASDSLFEDEAAVSIPATEVVDDLTGETDDLSSENGSFASLNLNGCPVMKPRPYQIEMVELSVQRNIIVAMDTGSGKTHIAVMRMLHELEHSPPHQLIWFLAPTVSLCQQQYDTILSQISSVQTKFLSGADNVERWTNQMHWNEVLKGVRIVVSTYQILLEALSHGFVKIESLSLIIYDEAHNCVGKHPGAKLMQNFYHGRKSQGLAVPKILGLTASPVMRSDPKSVSKIEQTLDAICRTPKKFRSELRLHVKLPAMTQVHYDPPPTLYTPAVESLRDSWRSMQIKEDPYYLSLLRNNTQRAQRALEALILNQKTWSREQIKSFYIIAQRVNEELGDWAADYYVSHVVSKVLKLVDEADKNFGILDVSKAEKQYVAKVLRQVKVNERSHSWSVTDKAAKLIEILLGESDPSTGIVFVKERATASVLAHLLRVHPQTREKFTVGTVVGSSQHAKRTQSIGELLDVESAKDTLSLFKSGKINLAIATSVLEEGIDVPECNLVVCFEKPANLKSFVQRRGRARHQDSKLVLLFDSKGQNLDEWHRLEADMKAIYEDEMRELQEILAQEDTEEHDGRIFRIEHTNAILDLDMAVAHLHHFCSMLPSKNYVDLRPDFICTEEDGFIRAKVILPISVHEAVRIAESQKEWLSEKNAIKDAAFQAYVALYHAGLINDNLLPLLKRDEVVDELMTSAVETRASLMVVNQQLDPWIVAAHAWRAGDMELSQCTITVGNLVLQVFLPVNIPAVKPFTLYWDAKIELVVTPSKAFSQADRGGFATAKDDTWAILQAAFGTRFSIEQKTPVMQFSVNYHLPLLSLLSRKPAANQEVSYASGFIRDNLLSNVAYIFQDLLPAKPSIQDVQQPYENYEAIPQSTPHFSVKRVGRRDDFLHKIRPSDQPSSLKQYSAVLPVSRCTVDEMPLKLVQFGMLMPSIIRRYEVYLIAQRLSDTLLKDVDVTDLSLIVAAICASSANEETNYQQLEFLGDSILKMCTSVQLTALYPLWHEGYLSFKKDRLVANSRLSRAAVDIGLDKFIITKSFTGLKWRPLFVENLLNATDDRKREMSSKVLADVVEALIGAAMVDGGIPKALACLQVFLPELDWQPLSTRRDFLYHRTPDMNLPSTLEPLERLIGYTFSKKALLTEAMTHASCNAGHSSLERCEFLGDSILDYIVVIAMQEHNLSHVQMHLLRTALVNADFLAFICMEWSIGQEIIELITPAHTSLPIERNTKTVQAPLWRFMRHTSPTVAEVQTSTLKRYAELRDGIKRAIEHGTHYPWALLARLQAQKFYSDLVESLLGAVWIDSGSFDTCREIVERMGILDYLRRILAQHVHVWHPKEELGIYADTEKVKYVLETAKWAEGEDGHRNGEKRYMCTVFVGNEEIVKVDRGVSKEEVQTRAAESAVAILKERKKRKEDKGRMEVAEHEAMENTVPRDNDLTMGGF